MDFHEDAGSMTTVLRVQISKEGYISTQRGKKTWNTQEISENRRSEDFERPDSSKSRNVNSKKLSTLDQSTRRSHRRFV